MEVFIRAIPFLLLFSGFNFTLNAQSEWKGWASANLTLSFTKKLDLRFSHLRSYTLSSPMENGFNQTSASLNYDLTKRLNILGGYMLTTYPSGSESTNRGFTRVSYKIPLAKVISWSNAIQAEYFSASETRYRSRLIYTTRFANRKEIPFLHLTLSATYWLYYNIGGNEIRYFDKTGTVLMRHSPDGLHRSRLFFTVASKIRNGLTLSLYYMKQNEFNLFSPEFRKINVVNPATGKITRAFDSYNVAGLTLSYDFNLYPSKTKKHKNHLETF